MIYLKCLLLLLTASLVVALRCGSAFAGVSCPSGQCCSESGWCDVGVDFCKSPQCQFAYCDSCDNLRRPVGTDTISIPRPQIGAVPYGIPIYDCITPGTFALTFDDGPWSYTSQLLDLLDSYGVKATFMVVGNNLGKGQIDDPSKPWGAILRRMFNSGHQIASHSWSHQDLTLVNSTIQRNEVIYNEMAFRNLFGWIPTYFRAPYLKCDAASGCLGLLRTLGYHLIDIDIDTKDYLYNTPDLIQTSKDRFSSAVSSDSTVNAYIELSHDIHLQTVVNLTAYMINTLRTRGYRPVPVGECLGDPSANWYRDASGTAASSATGSSSTRISSVSSSSRITTSSSSRSSTSAVAPSSTGLVVSTDQLCGGTTGKTCQGSSFGHCCSFYGYCGSTSPYCESGCQSGFGACNNITTVTTTTNGLCGSKVSSTCTGYGVKNCCSAYGYCGNTSAYCGTGCQPLFGKCT